MREQIGSLTLLQSPNQFRLTRDALALADFATLHNGDRVCDLGCGVGNLLIPLAARAEHLTLDGVELQPEAAQLCRENLRYNALRGEIVTGDLNVRHEALPWGGYDLVVANPPYFPQGQGKASPEAERRLARQEADYTLEKACQAAAHLCKNGGNFALCLRPERLVELFAALQKARLEPKRLQLLQSAPEREANLALVEARRGGKRGLRVLPMKIVR